LFYASRHGTGEMEHETTLVSLLALLAWLPETAQARRGHLCLRSVRVGCHARWGLGHLMVRIHEFVDSGKRRSFMYAPDQVIYQCKHCGYESGLDAWQIKTMPVSMARCADSPKRLGLISWLRGHTNCMA
jgi:hypothetical protein